MVKNSNEFKSWLMSWFEQCLLRRAPQDDALSYRALLWALFAYVVIDLVQASMTSVWGVSLGMTVLDTVVLVVFTWLVLRVMGRSARFVQTLTAVAGTGALLGLVAMPLVLQASRANQGDGQTGTLVLGWLVMLVWSITVQANIFRHALSTRYGAGLLVAGLHTVLVIALLDYFFPRATG